jgi:diguanylate cyclase (GGDEF)-like protein
VKQAVHNLIELVHELQRPMELDEILELVVEHAAVLLDTERVSVRLLDPTRTRLVATARAGTPLHESPNTSFELGEGLVGWIVENAMHIRSNDPVGDPRFAPRDGMKDEMGSFLGVPLVSGPVCMGAISAVHAGKDHFTLDHLDLLLLLAGIASPYIEIARLSRLARVDPLTGALSRRGLAQVFPDDAEGVVTPLSVVSVDVDRFKEMNDRFGHAVGDEVLRQVARLLGAVLRAGDAVVRSGGDAFLLVLAGVDVQQASRIAGRAQEMIRALVVDIGGTSLGITASMGVAQRGREEAREGLIARADAAMQEARESGGGRIRLAC